MSKYIKKNILVCLIIGTIVSAFAFLSYKGELTSKKAESIRNAIIYLASDIKSRTEEYTPSELANEMYLCGQSYTMTAEETEEVYVYDRTSDAIYGVDGADDFPAVINPKKISERTIGEYLYVPYSYDKNEIIWFKNSTDGISEELLDFVKRCAWTIPAMFVLIAVILLAVLPLLYKNKKFNFILSAIVFIWVMALFAILSYGKMQTDYKYQDLYIEQRFESVKYAIEYDEYLSDEDVDRILAKLSEDDLQYVKEKAGDDKRLAIIYAVIRYDSKFDTMNMEFTIDPETIWQKDVPLYEKVMVYVDDYFKPQIDYMLQVLMIGLFAVVLLGQTNYEKNKTGLASKLMPEGTDEESFNVFLENADKMKVIMTLKSLGSTLVVVLPVSMIKSWLKYDNGTVNQGFVSAIIFAASLIGCAVIYLVPNMMKLCRNIMVYVRVSLFMCFAGALICFLAFDTNSFTAGYIILTAGEGFMRMSTVMYCMSHTHEREGLYTLTLTARACLSGSLMGSVIGGILASVIHLEYMYLIAAATFAFLIIFSKSIKQDMFTHEIPQTLGLKEVLKIKDVIMFFILIMIPFGFENYFFTYKVSLDASSLGLTTVVVSFVYFLRNVCKMYVKESKANAKFWKGIPINISAPLCIIISAVIFAAEGAFTSAFVLIICSIAFAYVEASLNSRIYAYNFNLMNNNYDSSIANSAVVVTGRRIGKMVAPALVQAFGIFSLPIIMFVGGTTYLFTNLKKK